MNHTLEQWKEFLVGNFSTNGIAYDILKDWTEERAALLEALKPFAEFADVLKGGKPDDLIVARTKRVGTTEEARRELRVRDMFAARDVSLVIGEKKDA